MAARLRKLILTGDDFGRSHAINEAIERHHEAGVLTQASLMVNEPAAEEAVRIAQRHPALCVGLHLTLCDGLASSPSARTGTDRELTPGPAMAGVQFAFLQRFAAPLRLEIAAQFERFAGFGLRPVYWDGHTHLHLHPTVLRLTLPIAAERRFRFARLVRTPGLLGFLPWVFRALSRRAIRQLEAHQIGFVDHTFGLRETGRMTTAAMLWLVRELPAGVSEIYFHPGAEPESLNARVLLEQIDARDIELTSSERLLAATH